MSRMNYGPRFKNSAVSAGYRFDQRIAHDLADRPHVKPGTEAYVKGQIRNRIATEKTRVAKAHKKEDAVEAAQGPQQRAYDRVKQALVLLDFALEELNEAARLRNAPNNKQLVSRITLFEAIDKLKKSMRLP